jgi:hypothetical protein
MGCYNVMPVSVGLSWTSRMWMMHYNADKGETMIGGYNVMRKRSQWEIIMSYQCSVESWAGRTWMIHYNVGKGETLIRGYKVMRKRSQWEIIMLYQCSVESWTGRMWTIHYNVDEGSVAAAPSRSFCILRNKIATNMKIFMEIDEIRSRWVLCQL